MDILHVSGLLTFGMRTVFLMEWHEFRWAAGLFLYQSFDAVDGYVFGSLLSVSRDPQFTS